MAAPELKPIGIYDHYFFEEKTRRLFGICDGGLIDIKVEAKNKDEKFRIVDFFKKNSVLYLHIMKEENTGTEENPFFEKINYYYEQTGNDIINVLNLPEKDILGWGTYNSDNWELIEADFEGEPISKLFNLSNKTCAVFKQIYRVSEIKSGIFFNILESRIPGKRKGLWFFPKNRTSVNQIKEKGFLY